MRRQPTFLYLSAKVLSTIIEDNILHLPFKPLSPFLRGGHPSYAKISACRKRFCGRLTTQGMRRSNQAGGAEHFSGWGLKMTWNGDVEKWEDWGVAKFQPLALPSLQRGEGGGGRGWAAVPSFLSWKDPGHWSVHRDRTCELWPLSTPLSDYALCMGLNHKFITKWSLVLSTVEPLSYGHRTDRAKCTY